MPESSTIRKANQIADNFAYLDPEEAAERIAGHIRLYWPLAAQAELVELGRRPDANLKPLAIAAAELLVEAQPS